MTSACRKCGDRLLSTEGGICEACTNLAGVGNREPTIAGLLLSLSSKFGGLGLSGLFVAIADLEDKKEEGKGDGKVKD